MNNRKLLQQKVDTLTDPEVAEVLEYLDIMESLNTPPIRVRLGDQQILKVLYNNTPRHCQSADNGPSRARKRSNHSRAS